MGVKELDGQTVNDRVYVTVSLFQMMRSIPRAASYSGDVSEKLIELAYFVLILVHVLDRSDN